VDWQDETVWQVRMLVSTFVLTLGTTSKFELDNYSCLAVIIKCRSICKFLFNNQINI